MFFAKSAGSTEWKAVSSAIKTLVEEATFEVSSEGLIFRAMDPSHIALVDLSWPNSAWEKFSVDKTTKFTIRVEDFVKLIARSDAKDSIEIASDEEDSLTLRLMNGYKREFKVHLIETTPGTAPLPKLDLDVKLSMGKSVFEKILGDISVVADQVMISSLKEGVSFSGKSDIGAANIQLDKGGAELLELDVKQEAKASYNIDYILGICKAVGSAADVVVMEYASKKPTKIQLKLNEQGCRIDYFLAPRISEQ
ncbi:MAG: proliferating cell nuclear antigen (pcna) [Thaumarchaeota archaeon]|jgi:proliferating cell nuclear antigen|nr:proliferating cell nuclear antigen (pcna) [Nitrososphaerota archaeon]